MAGEQALRRDDDLKPLCSLDDETRRRLYEVVVAAGAPVSRDDVSAAAGVERSLVAYHLDKLTDEGLLEASFARPAGRGGPGAGRPTKYYQRAAREFAVSLPPREYGLAADVFARAAERDGSGAVRSVVMEAAAETGRELAGTADAGTLVDHLRRQGYEPYVDGDVIRLRNCPFHQLARDHTELVCGMNLALLSGLAKALEIDAQPRLDPVPGHCCVTLRQP